MAFLWTHKFFTWYLISHGQNFRQKNYHMYHMVWLIHGLNKYKYLMSRHSYCIVYGLESFYHVVAKSVCWMRRLPKSERFALVTHDKSKQSFCASILYVDAWPTHAYYSLLSSVVIRQKTESTFIHPTMSALLETSMVEVTSAEKSTQFSKMSGKPWGKSV